MSVPLAAAIAVLAVLAAMGAMLIARRLAPDGGLLGTPEPNHSGSVLAALGAGFAILTAFVLLLASQSYNGAKRSADTEARATQELFIASEIFASPERERLEGELVCYARAVVFDEWPLMAGQHESAAVDAWAFDLDHTTYDIDVRNPKESVAYAEWLDQMVVRDEAREERLQEAEPFVPTLLWIALVGGAVVLIGYVCMFANPRIALAGQLAVVGAIAAVVTVNLCVIHFLDHPYEDVRGSIQPDAMESSLGFMEDELEHHDAQPPPCDERGEPLS